MRIVEGLDAATSGRKFNLTNSTQIAMDPKAIKNV